MNFAKGNSRILRQTGPAPAVDKLVLATVNAPYKRDITAVALSACLANADFSFWPVHVATFFTDVDVDLIFRFAVSHGISESALTKAYLTMKAETGECNPNLEAELVRLGMAAP
jgi:hypothetical protein